MVDKKARLEIAKSIFEGVLDANLHQGEKASRLLIPVTFLVTPVIFLFNFFLENDVTVVWFGIDFLPILFLIYLFFTLAGSICIIETIGPSFEIKGWPGKDKEEKSRKEKNRKEEYEGPESLLFFKFIVKKKADDWMNIFMKEETERLEGYLETDKLQDRLIHDYVVESYQLAKKTHGKVKKNFFSHVLFYFSFCALFLMAYSGTISYFSVWNWITKGLVMLILIVFGLLIFGTIKEYFESSKKS